MSILQKDFGYNKAGAERLVLMAQDQIDEDRRNGHVRKETRREKWARRRDNCAESCCIAGECGEPVLWVLYGCGRLIAGAFELLAGGFELIGGCLAAA